MPETIRCPGCGTDNEPGATACAYCNFPLEQTPPAASEPEFKFDPGPRPVRRRPRPDAMQPVQMQLWLFAGIAIVMGIIYFAFQGFSKSNQRSVDGAAPEQQARADAARTALAKDSTNVDARIELANVLYDTGNWSEAIVNYRSAARLDPNRATTVVDMGVCYYNLGRFAVAESLFHHALELDARQAVAMFNLGIIAENDGRWDEALANFHHTLDESPPEPMRAAVQQHIDAVTAKARKAPRAGRSP
jgi:cytochrome c-type biogenesis protein CcmH/NrfG